MDTKNYKIFKQEAADALAVGRDPKKVILVYTGVMTLVTLLVTIVDVYLNNQISDTGGLGNLGIRSILSTIQSVLPIAQTVFLLCWDLGYSSATLRLGRKQYADHTDLLAGFHRFGTLLRCELLQGAMYLGILFASSYLGMQIFLLTPLAEPLMEMMLPLVSSETVMTEGILLDNDTATAFMEAATPGMIMTLLLFAALAIPFSYRYRMVKFYLLDHPQEGALAALRGSRIMMLRNKINLFKLDLSFWWYYLMLIAATIICYGDQILPMLGIPLSLPPMVSYFLFYLLYIAIQFGVYYRFRNTVEVTYARYYEAIRPKDQNNSIVLGNIFNM